MNSIPPLVPDAPNSGFHKTSFNKGPWIGCFIVVLVLIIGVLFAASWAWKKAKGAMESAGLSLEEFQTNPERAAAKVVLAVNPDIELVGEDQAAGTMTIKVKSSGETMSISYKDIAEGRIVFRNGKGEQVVIDGKGKDGSVVMTTDEGTTVIGGEGEVMKPPAWVPLHPSMTLMTGGMKNETETEEKGTCLAESTESVDALKKYYEAQQKSMSGGSSSAASNSKSTMATGESAVVTLSTDGKTLTVMLSKSEAGQKTNVMLNYSGPR